jgi:hypothetical protein
MRAYLIATTAVLAAVALAGCGNQPTSTSAGQATSQTSETSETRPPESPSDVATPVPPSTEIEPTPPGGKPQNPSGGQPPVTIGPDGPVVPAGVTEVPASQVDASALPSYFEYGNKVWLFNDGFALQLFAAASSSCTDAEAVVVDQAADSVKIVVRPMAQPQGGRPDDGICATVMTPRPVTVTLDTPLRDRMILLSAGR